MNRKTGIVVCNYNKSSDVVNCVQSIIDSDAADYDIVVVDNASEDDSVEKLRDRFGEQIEIIVNDENLGGSGGFNTGLRHMLKRDYEYLMCVDNDVLFDKETIPALNDFMDSNEKVGMVGSKICRMSDPARLQGMGARIDFEKYAIPMYYENEIDDEHIPEIVYCDYVPACSMMLRTSAVREVGIMKDDYFVYYDDIEWAWRFRLKGYQIAAISKSRVLHRFGMTDKRTTFAKYYMERNRVRFFMQYIPVENREIFAERYLSELYRAVAACILKGDTAVAETAMYAMDDAVHGVVGKATPYKIKKRDPYVKLERVLSGKESVELVYDGDVNSMGYAIQKIQSVIPDVRLSVTVPDSYTRDIDNIRKHYPELPLNDSSVQSDITLHLCPHIFQIEDEKSKGIYIDEWGNTIENEEEFQMGKSVAGGQKVFAAMWKPVMMAAMETEN